METQDIFKGLGVEVELISEFNQVRDVLSRIGFAPRNSNTLYQSCHLFHKMGHYAVMHFKEMFAFDGKSTNITTGDIARRNAIVNLLLQWNMIRLVKPLSEQEPVSTLAHIMVVPHKERENWQFITKYSIGKSSKNKAVAQ